MAADTPPDGVPLSPPPARAPRLPPPPSAPPSGGQAGGPPAASVGGRQLRVGRRTTLVAIALVIVVALIATVGVALPRTLYSPESTAVRGAYHYQLAFPDTSTAQPDMSGQYVATVVWDGSHAVVVTMAKA